MEPETLPIEELTEQTTAQIILLRTSIDASVNEAGRLADWLSGDDGTQISGVHGLQMCYDRLREAEMWAGQALREVQQKG